MRAKIPSTVGQRSVRRVFVVLGSAALTAIFFFALPLLQAFSTTTKADTLLRSIDVAALPPPPPPPPVEEPEEEPEPEEPPPDLDQAPLDLSQLDLMLGASLGSGFLDGDLAAKLGNLGSGDDTSALFGLADLDQRPRVLDQVSPDTTPAMRRIGGKVVLLFLVDENGNVVNPIVKRASDPMFKRPALEAIKKWKFEPGKRNGKAVRFRMKQSMTFPKK